MREPSANHSGAPLNWISRTGGPFGSTATMALTRSGRRSAIAQPKGPDCECVNTTAGPIRSSNATPAAELTSCCLG